MATKENLEQWVKQITEEGKTVAQLQKNVLDGYHHPAFHLTFQNRLGDTQEVEHINILHGLISLLGQMNRKRFLKIMERRWSLTDKSFGLIGNLKFWRKLQKKN